MSDAYGGDNDFDDPLNDPYPDEFAFLHIGTAINADTNELRVGYDAFDPGLLEQEHLLDWSPGKSETAVKGDGTSTEAQDVWGWSSAASMKFNAGIVAASAKLYVQQSLNACRRSSKMKVFGGRTNSREVSLKAGSSQQYMDCRTKLFAEKMDAVVNAARTFNEKTDSSAAALVSALTDFYDTFGTGYVHAIHEVAVGIFEGTLESQNQHTGNDFTTGGGFSVSIPLVSAGVAAEYFKNLKNDTKATGFTARAVGRPLDGTPLTWAQDQADRFAQNGIDKCSDQTAWDPVFEKPPLPEVPEHEPQELPDVNLLRAAEPARVVGNSEASAIRSAIQHAIREIQYDRLDSKYKAAYPDDRDRAFQAEFTELREQASLTPESINDQAKRVLQGGQTRGAVAKAFTGTSSARAAGDPAPGQPSGYAPSGYVYQPWTNVFPELADISKMCTTAQVVFGQALVWFSMRATFAQYLDHCAQYEAMLGPVITLSANQFRAALQTVGAFLTTELKRDDKDKGLDFVQRLEDKLKAELKIDDAGADRFPMYDHYWYWIDNYAWLKEVPFGVVAVVEREGEYYYQENPYPECPLLRKRGIGCTATETVLLPGEYVRLNAYRLYPILSTDANGKPYFIWVGPPSKLTGDWADAELSHCERMSLTEFWPFQAPHGDFAETTLPALIHQSPEYAKMIADSEGNGQLQPHLAERWANRQAMWGMNLYPGFDSGAEPEDYRLQRYRLLKKAGKLARDASRHGAVLPEIAGPYEGGWRLATPAEGTVTKGAYFRKYDATFFWGPGPEGSDLFEVCDIRLVPINYTAVKNANGVKPGSDIPYGVKAGGGPMWMEPRTDKLVDQLKELAN